MNLKVDELKLILMWFDYAESSLDDEDLELYDRIKEHLEEKGEDLSDKEDDELTYFSSSEDNDYYEEDEYDEYDD